MSQEYIWIVFDRKFEIDFEDEYLWLGSFESKSRALKHAMDYAGCFSETEEKELTESAIENILSSKRIHLRRLSFLK